MRGKDWFATESYLRFGVALHAGLEITIQGISDDFTASATIYPTKSAMARMSIVGPAIMPCSNSRRMTCVLE